MDRCDECAFVYAEVPRDAIARSLRRHASGVSSRLTTHDSASLRRRPSPQVWSGLEYGCHVRDVLNVQRERVLLALTERRPALEPMRREERVTEEDYNGQDPLRVASELALAADLLAGAFERLSPGQWGRTLLYNWPEPAARDLTWVGRHTIHECRHHTSDIDRGLAP